MKIKAVTKIILAFLSIFVLAVACKKNTVSEVTKTVLITSTAWKYDGAGIDINGDGTSDTPLPSGILETCFTDNLITFKSDKTGTFDEGPTKCDPADPQSTPFGWELTNNETEMNFTPSIIPGLGSGVKIVELTATKLRLSAAASPSVTGLPLPVTLVISLKH